jgi:hypothetical protein
VAISSASIPAVSFVITAIMPVRGHQTYEMNFFDPARSSGFADCCGQSQIKGRHRPFPSLIASHSQLKERTRKRSLNGIVA